MQLNWVTVIGLIAAGCTTFSFVPQVLKIIKTRRTEDISLLMYAVLTTGLFLWLLYGLIIGDVPLILANAISFSLSTVVLILKLKHG